MKTTLRALSKIHPIPLGFAGRAPFRFVFIAISIAAALCTAPIATARTNHTATLLQNGTVLVAGGADANGAIAGAQIYDPATETWTATGNLVTARYGHAAILLQNGKVLVVGGSEGNQNLSSAELYNPATGNWTATGSMSIDRQDCTVTLLSNGKVLVAGGFSLAGATYLSSAELYDPTTGTWTATNPMASKRKAATATLLATGKVLVAGGYGGSAGFPPAAELYDPTTGNWTGTGSLVTPREYHQAQLLGSGKVLVWGGEDNTFATTYSAELYDPASGTWTATGSVATNRTNFTATLLPNGKLLVAAGYIPSSKTYVATALLYDPASGTGAATGSLATARANHTATLLPNGKVLVVGGYSDTKGDLSSAELYDPAAGTWAVTGSLGPPRTGDFFTNSGNLVTPRAGHTATLLPNGKVLITGGLGANSTYLASSELYDPATGTWAATGNLATARLNHTATLLPNGKVLVTGGKNSSAVVASAELYDPASGTWSATGSLSAARYSHTVTLLLTGKVLVTGGVNTGGQTLATAELYDPGTGTWAATGSLANARFLPTATLLKNGKVLVAGGASSSGFYDSTELYDPASGTWSASGNLVTGRDRHTATLLTNGMVLVVGGAASSPILGSNIQYLSSAELYDPASGTWAVTDVLHNPSYTGATATLLPNGMTLHAGGLSSPNSASTVGAELYNSFSETWKDTAQLNTARSGHTATLLANGKVLIAGGIDANYIATSELYAAPPPGTLLNISTRMRVLTDDKVLIGGFIITGTDPKKVIIRGMGPSLNGVGITLSDPTLELHMPDGTVIKNDNWKINDQTGQSQEADIRATTIPPANDLESAIVANLSPGAYTAILAGKTGGTGIGLVEVYDLAQGANSKLANISTRGFVDTGNNVMIGGLIVGATGGGTGAAIVRALGPSLPVAGALSDPILELHDGSGTTIASNDNWKIDDQSGQSQENLIRATTIPPSNDLESAIVATLPPGNYTAIVRGKNNATGVGLVEVYNLQ